MLKDLSRALFDAISGSSEVSRSLHKIREEGYSLHVVLDFKREDQDRPEVETPPRHAASTVPTFKINGQDLSFLRSIGIDPTRRGRRRRPAYRSLKREDAW